MFKKKQRPEPPRKILVHMRSGRHYTLTGKNDSRLYSLTYWKTILKDSDPNSILKLDNAIIKIAEIESVTIDPAAPNE